MTEKEDELKNLEIAADDGDTDASYELGMSYAMGHDVEINPSRARMWLSIASDKGHAGATAQLKIMDDQSVIDRALRYCRGGEYSGYAMQCCRKAADLGYAEAQLHLGNCYSRGIDVDQDHKIAVKWYRKAAEQGVDYIHNMAQCRLGLYHRRGLEVDLKEALKWYRKAAASGYGEAVKAVREYHEHKWQKFYRKETWALLKSFAEQGNPDAQFDFGERCRQGINIEWLAELGNLQAQYGIGIRYKNGWGVEQNDKEAVKWFHKAAEQGHVTAQFKLGDCYHRGIGVEQDLKEAEKWRHKAVEAGYIVPLSPEEELLNRVSESVNPLSPEELELKGMLEEDLQKRRKAADYERRQMKFLMYGKRLMTDHKEAVKWFRQAAEQGHADAQCRLGVVYGSGIGGVKQDKKEATKWLRKAADQGVADAQHRLGVHYLRGIGGVARYPTEAVKWFRKAAEQGHANAQCVLGEMYEQGISVDFDSEEAVKWYTKAAAQGHSRAQLKLGSCYYSGSGIGMDLEAAKYWVEAAIDNGNDDAVRFWRKHKFHKL